MAGRPLRRARMARMSRNPSLRDYASVVASKAAKAGRSGAEAVARKAREMAEEAEQHASRLESARKAASVSPDRALEVLAKEHGYKLVKANPAGWMHDESARAVRKAIASRSPEDIRRARALQVRNEKARSRDRSYLPNPKKNGGCACGCGGTCGKKNPESYLVYYNGFVRKFSSKSAAQKFARSIRGGGVKPVVKRA